VVVNCATTSRGQRERVCVCERKREAPCELFDDGRKGEIHDGCNT